MNTVLIKRPRYNRRFIAKLALDVLAPLLRQQGKYTPSHLKMPAVRTLQRGDFQAHLLEEDMQRFGSPPLLGIYFENSGKVLALRLDPLTIVSFRPGPWIDQLMELALRRCGDTRF